MLLPEQAKLLLAEWQLPEDENRIAEGVKKLPAGQRKIAEPIFADPEDPHRPRADDTEPEWNPREAAAQIDRLSVKERAKIFAVVAPQMTPAMEAAWQLLKTTTYQAGYQRKAFRAPNHPDATAEKRIIWLMQFSRLARPYRPEVVNPVWLAAWASHMLEGYYAHLLGRNVGPLLAAVLNEKNAAADEVFETLRQSLTNQHEIGGMGRHVYTALLLSNRPEGWELVEKTLLAAQRQEGLRQAILEVVDESHPEAFRRMLRLILEHDLLRFASVVRAVDVWFGQFWAAASAGFIKKMLTQAIEFLEDPSACGKAIQGNDAEAAFLALWCAATEDAVASVALAEKLLSAKSVELRYVAATHLANLDLDVASAALTKSLGDEDLRVALLALPEGQHQATLEGAKLKTDDRFEGIERLLARVPEKSVTLKPLVWPWTETEVKQSRVAACLTYTLGSRPASRLIPHLPKLEPYVRSLALAQIAESKPWDAATRQTIIEQLGDSVANVRAVALKALLNESLTPAEAERIEGYLTRKSGDLRRAVLDLLLKQSDAAALASSSRLLTAKDASQRLAGLELLRHMTDAKRCVPDCRAQAAAFQAARKKIGTEEQSHLDEIAKDKAAIPTLDDALGLMNPAERTPVVAPRNFKTPFITPAAVACLKSLDELVHQHRETPIKYKSYVGMQEELLGNIGYGFPSPNYTKPRDKQEKNLPLAEVWLEWFANRSKDLKDKDGLELLRAGIWTEFSTEWSDRQWTEWAKSSPARKQVAEILSGGQAPQHLRYPQVVEDIVSWLRFLVPVDAHDYLLAALETAYSLVPPEDMQRLREPRKEGSGAYWYHDDFSDWRRSKAYSMWNDQWVTLPHRTGVEVTAAQRAHYVRLMRWHDEPFPGAPRKRIDVDLLLAAYAAKEINLHDVADHLLAPRGAGNHCNEGFDLLSRFTARKLSAADEAWLAKHPEVRQLVEQAVVRVLDLELSRGDAPTAATTPSYWIRSLRGIETLRRVLQSLGKEQFKPERGNDRRQTLTHFASIALPAENETPEEFAKVMMGAVKVGQFPEERLLQLAFLAPQWTKCVEAYFGWDQFSEGVYWFLAHMRSNYGLGNIAAIASGQEEEPEAETVAVEAGNDDADDDTGDGEKDDVVENEETAAPAQKKLSAWERLILERTPLTDAERDEGAIDVGWFRRTHAQLGDKRWQALAAAARFAANPSQAKRALFIANVLLSKVKRTELVTGIKKKQLKEHVRLLGLLPLAGGAKRDADLIERCQVLREYRRYANQLSGLTKPAALRAWEIGMKNLAQTAGYADPLRLEWAVGAEAVKDLARGPVAVTKDGVTITLALDEMSKPTVTIAKGNKELKSIPPALKKDKRVVELTGRVTDLKRQASAIRQSLEGAMCRGDTFKGEELRAWCGHALLTPLLSRLVVVGEGILGYPDKGGKALRDQRGKLEPVKPSETLRLAHPHDLLATDAWQDWQRECFQAERVQPFKQVFRELYVVTAQEKKDGAISHRYDGQQVQPRQALALFGNRGWNTQDGIFKIFHDVELTVSVDFQSGVNTPLEVEGATLAGISFTRRGEWKPMKLADVPPRLFSEVMRDLDLVVSVAHAGGVDPEASASTVEMRSGLLRETCALLKLKNVRLKPNHALIDGQLANYSIHLGSGIVHRMPGGSLCIVPVHAQHRGRIFLPFVDDDPRTAEVISKVLLLARDHEIQDPTILEQIRQ